VGFYDEITPDEAAAVISAPLAVISTDVADNGLG
jgi:hypothetical protein